MQFLHEILQECAESHGTQTALIFEDQTLSYGDVQLSARQLAQQLSNVGVKAGDCVAYLDENCIEYPLVVFAASMLGAVFVPINFRYAVDEVTYILDDSKPTILLATPDYIELAENAAAKANQDVTVMARPNATDLKAAKTKPIFAEPDISSEQPLMVMYTSGTTGFPKGVLFSHRAYLANVKSIIDCGDLTPDDRMMVALPLFHNGGLTAVLMPTLMLGGVALIMPRGFHPDDVLRAIELHRISSVMWVPTMLAMLLNSDVIKRYDSSSLRKIWYGSSPIDDDLLERSKLTFGAGHYQFYGMTETGMTAVLKPEEHDYCPGATGRAMPAADLRLVDENKQNVAVGMIGEILSRQHPLGMIGYLGREKETDDVVSQGWIQTGDLARNLGDGYFVIVGRMQDMIISGAENVYPREIELLLLKHPRVQDAAVFGIPDAVFGEAVCAAVVPKPNANLTGDEIIKWCADRLAGYKKPREVLFLEELPKNAAGKTLKNNLRAPYWEGSKRAI